MEEPLPWPNTTLLRGDIVDAVRAVKAQSGGVLAIMGSGMLTGSLMAANLIDEYLLMIHPLVLDAGRRLFPADVPLRLTSSVTTATGVVIATYRPARGVQAVDYAPVVHDLPLDASRRPTTGADRAYLSEVVAQYL